MAYTKSAKKANRVNARRHIFNVRRKKTMKDAVKEVDKLVTAQKGTEAVAALPNAYKAVDKAVKKGVIKAGTAARIKSRIARAASPKK